MDKRYRDIKTLPSGDIGFSYSPIKVNDTVFDLLFTISFLLVALIGITYHYVDNPIYLLLFIVPISLFIYNYKSGNKEKQNESIEVEAIEEILDTSTLKEIAKHLYNQDVEVLYRNYVIRQSLSFGQYERYYYVCFSNNKIIRFKVVSRKGKDSDIWNLTIRINPEECKYDEHARFVLPLSERLKNKISLDTPVVVIGLLFMVFLVLSACFLLPAIYYTKVAAIVYFSWFIIVLIFFFISQWLRIPNRLYEIIRFPEQLVNLWIRLTVTFLSPLFGLLIVLVSGGVIASILYMSVVYVYRGGICWIPELAVFLGVSTISILSVHFIGLSRSIMERCGFFGVRETKTMEMPILGLTEYILQKENINAIIYLSYFVFLLYASIRLFVLPTPDSPIWNEGIDSAVIKAFVLHIAATNMFAKMSEKKIKIPKIHDYIKDILGLK